MEQETFRRNHRLARCQALGTLACSLSRELYDFFLYEVYDIRFPRITGGHGCLPATFDVLRGGIRQRYRLNYRKAQVGEPRRTMVKAILSAGGAHA